ncbi:hypothetical protein [Paenibacillus polymyxa]|uniref:hypothetical protein n=1 Tax=Paenibacillus polymyxa TaxID=1406 RepID=UPI00287F73A9|nr:hypothetical protein [Paenibacillus polymyxa]
MESHVLRGQMDLDRSGEFESGEAQALAFAMELSPYKNNPIAAAFVRLNDLRSSNSHLEF